MTICLSLRTVAGVSFNVGGTVRLVDVQTVGDPLPSFVIGETEFEVQVTMFSDLVRVVRALNPDITEERLRRAIMAQTADVGRALTRS